MWDCRDQLVVLEKFSGHRRIEIGLERERK
jgi:hypothetical protein